MTSSFLAATMLKLIKKNLIQLIRSIIRKTYLAFCYFFNYLLMFVFKFEKWHVTPYLARPYAVALVEYLNSSKMHNSILEIGCGLGDILRRVKYDVRLGLDINLEAVQAANFISQYVDYSATNINFLQSDLFSSDIKGKYDVVVSCNWIHRVPPDVLREKFHEIYNNLLNDY